MDKTGAGFSGKVLYTFTSTEGSETIETRLIRDDQGSLTLLCRREDGQESDSVCLPDLGKREETCLAFARAVAESHTYPRILPELWEDYMP